MLQSPTLPESWRALLDAFRPAFRRSRTFALFALLATGLVTQTTRRTVVGMLAGAGMAAAVSFHAVQTTWEARMLAEQRGWRCGEDGDLCPDCAAHPGPLPRVDKEPIPEMFEQALVEAL